MVDHGAVGLDVPPVHEVSEGSPVDGGGVVLVDRLGPRSGVERDRLGPPPRSVRVVGQHGGGQVPDHRPPGVLLGPGVPGAGFDAGGGHPERGELLVGVIGLIDHHVDHELLVAVGQVIPHQPGCVPCLGCPERGLPHPSPSTRHVGRVPVGQRPDPPHDACRALGRGQPDDRGVPVSGEHYRRCSVGGARGGPDRGLHDVPEVEVVRRILGRPCGRPPRVQVVLGVQPQDRQELGAHRVRGGVGARSRDGGALHGLPEGLPRGH